MFSRLAFTAAILAVSGLAARVAIRADDTTGKPISVGLAANRTQDAASVFGTTSDSTNFLTLPKDLCIVPMYANDAGMGDEKKPLITQQALDICPQATTIVVSNATTSS